MMGTHTSSVNKPICKVERAAASRANTPMSIATAAARKAQPVKYALANAEGDQGQAEEDSGDAQALVAGGEPKVLAVPLGGEPGVEHPCGCDHDRGFTAAIPGTHSGRAEDAGDSEEQQPEQEKGEQNAGSGGGGALEEQADAGCEGDEGAEVDEELACRYALGYGVPDGGEVAFEEAEDSEGDHSYRKDCMTYTCDAHRLSSSGELVHHDRWLIRSGELIYCLVRSAALATVFWPARYCWAWAISDASGSPCFHASTNFAYSARAVAESPAASLLRAMP
jgi:hypothetical protein